jgi:hypothetical protein
MRVGVVGVPMVPPPIGPWRITSIPGSSSVLRPLPPGVVRPELDADVPSSRECQAITYGPACSQGHMQRSSLAPFSRERASRNRKPFNGKRLHSRKPFACTAYRATTAQAAALSAKSG